MINKGSNKDKTTWKMYRTSPPASPRQYSLSVSSVSLLNVMCVIF